MRYLICFLIGLAFVFMNHGVSLAQTSPADQATTLPETSQQETVSTATSITSDVLVSMNGGPKIWVQPGVEDVDFNSINVLLSSPLAIDLDMRVAITDNSLPSTELQTLARNIGAIHQGTVVVMSPSIVALYSNDLEDLQIQKILSEIQPQLSTSRSYSEILDTLIARLSASNNILVIYLGVGIAILVVGLAGWFVWKKGIPFFRNRPSPEEEFGEGEIYEVDNQYQDDVYQEEPSSYREHGRVNEDMPASSFAVISARHQLDVLGERIVALSPRVVESNDLQLLSTFESIGRTYSAIRADLDGIRTAREVEIITDAIATVSNQIISIEQRV